MNARFTKILFAIIFVVSVANISFSQTPQSTSTPKPESNYVDFTGFKGKVIEIKNRDASELANILRPLGSGFKGAIITGDSQNKVITIRDFPENIAAIEEAIKRLDVPQPEKLSQRSPDVEMHLYALLASNQSEVNRTDASAYPAELREVLEQLQKTMNYKSYHLLTPIIQRGFSLSGFRGQGIITVGPPLFEKPVNANYNFSTGSILVLTKEKQPVSLEARQFSFTIDENADIRYALLGKASISNTFTINDGEKLVIGTAGLKDKALVLVLSMKVVK